MGLQEDARCALWSVIYDPWRMVSGVKATQMRVYMDDFDVVPKAHCADNSTNQVMEDPLSSFMYAQKPTILYTLKHSSTTNCATTNQVIYDAVAAEHADPRCSHGKKDG